MKSLRCAGAAVECDVLQGFSKDGDSPSVEVDMVVQAAEIQCGVLNQVYIGL